MLPLYFNCEKVVQAGLKSESQAGHDSPFSHCCSQWHLCQPFASSLFVCWHLHKLVSSAVKWFCWWGARTSASYGSKGSSLAWHLQQSSRLYFVFYCLGTSNTNSQWHPALSECINLKHFRCFHQSGLFYWSCNSTKHRIGSIPKKLEESSGSELLDMLDQDLFCKVQWLQIEHSTLSYVYHTWPSSARQKRVP